ncbi:hypothetical protein TruAng_007287 [Truncatella angustata]|nr:hypothetical protein TruAng_007287 [Truncatella angustata]
MARQAHSPQNGSVAMPRGLGRVERNQNPKPLSTQRDGGPTGTQKRSTFADIVDEEIAQERRRKLLRKPDWAGLEMQQPIELVFPGQSQASSGRLWSDTGPRRSGAILSPRLGANEPRTRAFHRSHQNHAGPLRRAAKVPPIQITIGSQSITDATSSQILQDPEMPKLKAHRLSVLPHTGELSSGSERRNGKSGSSNSRLHGDSMLLASNDRTHVQTMNPRADVADSRHRQYGQDKPEHSVHASSDIYEPIPRRTRISTILQRSPSAKSTDSESINVEVGRPKRGLPSEIADNERWMNRLLPEDNLVIPLTRGSSLLESSIPRPSISPGISERHSQVDLGTIEKPEASSLGSSCSATGKHAIALEMARSNHNVARSMSRNVSGSYSMQQARMLDITSGQDVDLIRQQYTDLGDNFPRHLKHAKTLDDTPSWFRNPQAEHDKPRHLDKRQSSVSAGDDNTQWMKFIFGDHNDDFDSRAYQEAAHDAAKDIKPSQSSGSSDELPMTDIGFQCAAMAHNPVYPTIMTDGDQRTTSDYANASLIATKGSESSPILQSGGRQPFFEKPGRDKSTCFGFQTSPNSASRVYSQSMEAQNMSVPGVASDMATAGDSIATSSPKYSFRFSAPQMFMGKLAILGATPSEMAPPPLPSKARKRKAKGLRTKKIYERRPDIRALPDFIDDPIEEFEEPKNPGPVYSRKVPGIRGS